MRMINEVKTFGKTQRKTNIVDDEKYSSPGLVLGGYMEAGEVAFA